MYKVFENGTEKMCSAEEAEAIIADFNIIPENSPTS